MGSQVVALAVVGNEGTEFDVLPDHLLSPHVIVLLAETVSHAVVGHLGSVGDIREYGMIYVAVDGFHDCRSQLLA